MQVGTNYKILDITPEKLDEIREAAAKAAAVSEQKDLEAKEASEAADRAKKVLEENEHVLQLAKEALDRCNVLHLPNSTSSLSIHHSPFFSFLQVPEATRFPYPKSSTFWFGSMWTYWRTGSFIVWVLSLHIM